PEETAATFQAHTRDGDGPYLRTGDLGFILDQELFVTGRLEELIIIRGRNVYPQDVERTVETCHPALRPGGTAAFSVAENQDEQLVILQEVRDSQPDEVLDEIIATIRERVADEHELLAHTVALLEPGSLKKTTSGKVQRSACRDAHRAGTLAVVRVSSWKAFGDADAEVEFVAPSTPTEKKLARVWAQVLDADRVGVHDNFLDLGGQSLHANQCIARI